MALVILMGGSILLTTMLGSRRAVRTIAAELLNKTNDAVVVRIATFFEGPSTKLEILRGQLTDRVVDPSNEKGIDGLLSPVIDVTSQVSAAMVADSRGRQQMLRQVDGHWQTRLVHIDEWGKEAHLRDWWRDGTAPKTSVKPLEYDPRTRPWFKGAVETRKERGAGAIFWSTPYEFYTARMPGITAAVAFDLGDGIDHVVALDILLSDITDFTQNYKLGQRGEIAVLTSDNRMLGLPRSEGFDSNKLRERAYLHYPEELGLNLVTDTLAASKKLAPADDQSVRFKSGGEPWWGRVDHYTLVPGRDLVIAVAVPEAELLGNVRLQRLIILGIVLALLVVALVRAVILSRRFSAPVEALAAKSERISAGDFSPGDPIVSNVTEIRRLASAQDELRTAVQARMKLNKVERELDLAREIQCGLMPHEPPDLPGFQIAGWNQAADQTGGDYFDWLQLPSGQTVVTLADVTGHGIAPALIVSVCRAYLRAATAIESVGLSEAVGWVNDLLYDDTPDERFVTAAVGLLDPKTAKMGLLSAGHGPNLFYEAATDTVHKWDGDLPPLGVVDGLQNHIPAPREIQFKSGDMLVLTTDGFFEWMNADHDQFGIQRMIDFVQQHNDQNPEDFIEGLYHAVLEFADGTTQADDLTALVLKKT
jgi:serine phosphatase RsbU (regulator of sigma subunit)